LRCARLYHSPLENARSLLPALLTLLPASLTLHTFKEVNLRAGMVVTRLVLPAMMRRGSGAVLFLSSITARQFMLAPGHAAYVASKMGVAGFLDGLFAEARTRNVKGV
jgi:short-subunit dehydrogenase